jgi:maleate cis-trans isomerase
VFISCTAFRGVDAINLIEDRLGKPVLSSNQVTFWKLGQMVDDPSVLSSGAYAHQLKLA